MIGEARLDEGGFFCVYPHNGDIEAGEHISTSELPGYGQRQDDDLLHSFTLGKATETVDWDAVTETVASNGQEYRVCLLAVVYTSGR
ncbi:MAG: hypothetical protein BMS9Abin28_2298 [Anaerolineae bacterium]|nr:MAG: hypothetical protein BMS9Abin28_2298 [Anaerolineae bacterium]